MRVHAAGRKEGGRNVRGGAISNVSESQRACAVFWKIKIVDAELLVRTLDIDEWFWKLC